MALAYAFSLLALFSLAFFPHWTVDTHSLFFLVVRIDWPASPHSDATVHLSQLSVSSRRLFFSLITVSVPSPSISVAVSRVNSGRLFTFFIFVLLDEEVACCQFQSSCQLKISLPQFLLMKWN